MHPQYHELKVAIETFLRNAKAAIEVHCPDKRVSATLLHAQVQSRRLLFRAKSTARLRIPAPRDSERQLRAEQLGFRRIEKESLDPFTRRTIRFASFEADFSDADEGVAQCIAALQDVHQIGDAWLWITDLDYDNWPKPLPKPEPWPPVVTP